MTRINFRTVLLFIFLHVFFMENTGEASENKKKSQFTFLENKGQWSNEILFKGQSLNHNVYLLKDGLSFSQILSSDEKKDPDFLIWNLKFMNYDPSLSVNGNEGRESVNSFISGSDKSKWIIHPNEYKQVSYSQIYKNIDFLIYENNNNLEYDYVIHPNGNIRSIKLNYENIQRLTINSNGDLEVSTGGDKQIQKAPIAWQIINGKRQNVNVEYIILNDSTFSFNAVNSYNADYDLIIDPLFQMVWCSYTKATGTGNNINYCFANTMDKDGNVYLTGMVDGTFPTTPGAYSGPGNVYPEIFVSKFSSDGTTLIYSTYLPGNSSEFGTAIAVDDSGRAYVTGDCQVNITGITNFPSTANAYQPVHNAGGDAFLTVLNANGTGLVYSTFLGGTGSETSYGIALGNYGTAYITGFTSTGNFPVKASTPLPSGDNDLFVSKFDINQTGINSLIYSVRIGGGSFCNTLGRGIAVNSMGNAFVTGKISSSFGTPTFPVTSGAYSNTFNPGLDGSMSFAIKLSAGTPVTLNYSTYLSPGSGNAIAVDAVSNDAFIVGSAYTFAFPTTPNALQPVHAGNHLQDAFAIRLNASGSSLVYSTFLGGPFEDIGTGVAVNSNGEAYVSGIAQDSFPTSSGGFQPVNAGREDFFVVNLNATGTGYACGGSTFVGGSDEDYTGSFYDFPSPKISLRDHGGNNDTVCLSSTSHSQDFPTTPGVYGPLKVNSIADQPVFFKLTCASPGSVPTVNLSSSDTSWCDKRTVDFYDLSTNNPTSWQWYFPGGIPGSSTQQNPAGIFYPNTGTYPVTLIACNSFGCDSVTYSNQITILPMPPQPMPTINGDTLCLSNFVSYQWYEVSNPAVILSTNSCFVPPSPGNYFALVVDSNGCQTISQALTNGTNEIISGDQIAIIPNPVNDRLNIELSLSQSKNISVSIITVDGRVVKTIPSKLFRRGINTISEDLSELSKGVYFCEFISGEYIKTIKIIKN